MPKYVDADVMKVAFLYGDKDVCDDKDEFDTKWGASQERIEEIIDFAPAADVEPKQRWIPVTERLPEEKISPMTMDYQYYPCVFDGRAGKREVRYYKFGKGHFWHGSGYIDEYVTHWAEPMPLPDPPKEDTT